MYEVRGIPIAKRINNQKNVTLVHMQEAGEYRDLLNGELVGAPVRFNVQREQRVSLGQPVALQPQLAIPCSIQRSCYPTVVLSCNRRLPSPAPIHS